MPTSDRSDRYTRRVFDRIQPPSKIKPGNDHSLFKNSIPPMWEDHTNRKGGRWEKYFRSPWRRQFFDRQFKQVIVDILAFIHFVRWSNRPLRKTNLLESNSIIKIISWTTSTGIFLEVFRFFRCKINFESGTISMVFMAESLNKKSGTAIIVSVWIFSVHEQFIFKEEVKCHFRILTNDNQSHTSHTADQFQVKSLRV